MSLINKLNKLLIPTSPPASLIILFLDKVKLAVDAGDLESLIDSLKGKRDDILAELGEFIEEETLNTVAILQFVPMYNFATGGA